MYPRPLITSASTPRIHNAGIRLENSHDSVVCTRIEGKQNCLELLNELKARLPIPTLYTRSRVKSKLQPNREVEISTNTLQASLICPVSKARIETPCRGRYCMHIQCLDAQTMIQINLNKPNWMCPICGTKINMMYDLLVDGLFQQILQTVPKDINEVTFYEDGSWGLNNEKETESLDIIDLEASLSFIDLTGSDDEEQRRKSVVIVEEQRTMSVSSVVNDGNQLSDSVVTVHTERNGTCDAIDGDNESNAACDVIDSVNESNGNGTCAVRDGESDGSQDSTGSAEATGVITRSMTARGASAEKPPKKKKRKNKSKEAERAKRSMNGKEPSNETDKENTTRLDKGPVTGADKENTTRWDKGPVTEADKENTTRWDKGPVTGADKENTTRWDKGPVTGADKENTTRWDKGPVTGADKDKMSTADKEPISGNDRENSIRKDKEQVTLSDMGKTVSSDKTYSAVSDKRSDHSDPKPAQPLGDITPKLNIQIPTSFARYLAAPYASESTSGCQRNKKSRDTQAPYHRNSKHGYCRDTQGDYNRSYNRIDPRSYVQKRHMQYAYNRNNSPRRDRNNSPRRDRNYSPRRDRNYSSSYRQYSHYSCNNSGMQLPHRDNFFNSVGFAVQQLRNAFNRH